MSSSSTPVATSPSASASTGTSAALVRVTVMLVMHFSEMCLAFLGGIEFSRLAVRIVAVFGGALPCLMRTAAVLKFLRLVVSSHLADGSFVIVGLSFIF